MQSKLLPLLVSLRLVVEVFQVGFHAHILLFPLTLYHMLYDLADFSSCKSPFRTSKFIFLQVYFSLRTEIIWKVFEIRIINVCFLFRISHFQVSQLPKPQRRMLCYSARSRGFGRLWIGGCLQTCWRCFVRVLLLQKLHEQFQSLWWHRDSIFLSRIVQSVWNLLFAGFGIWLQ